MLAVAPSDQLRVVYWLASPFYAAIGVILWRRFPALRDIFGEAGYVGGMTIFAFLWPVMLVWFAVILAIASAFLLLEKLFRVFRHK